MTYHIDINKINYIEVFYSYAGRVYPCKDLTIELPDDTKEKVEGELTIIVHFSCKELKLQGEKAEQISKLFQKKIYSDNNKKK